MGEAVSMKEHLIANHPADVIRVTLKPVRYLVVKKPVHGRRQRQIDV